MKHAAAGPRPKESLFYEPMVYLLGRLTGFKPYIGVHHEKVRDDVLRLAGIDPDDCPWPLNSTSSKKRDGLYRVVHFAWYHQTRQYRPESEALCARPIEGARGEWALTTLGVRRAKELKSKYEGKIQLSSGPNQTARFIGDRWEVLYDKITNHLRRKMPRSEDFGKVDDHAMNWIERIISRDGLRSRLEQGKSVPPSQVQAWARRSAYTDIRNEGREPVCRVFHGALTKREIGLYDPANWTEVVIPRTINDSEQLAMVSYSGHGEDDHVGDTMDNLRDLSGSGDVEGTVINEDSFDAVLDRMSDLLAEELDEGLDPDMHRRLAVDHYVKEMTIREIAEAHGLKNDPRKISAALDRVRNVMIRARDQGELDDLITR
jgi:hypothetical protein